VLAGTVVPIAVERALLSPPEIDAEAPVDLVLRGVASAHDLSVVPGICCCPDSPPDPWPGGGVVPPTFSRLSRRRIAAGAKKSVDPVEGTRAVRFPLRRAAAALSACA